MSQALEQPSSQFLIRHVSLRQIQIFEAVSRRLSFTRAAEELYLTQPTVSAQVKSFVEAIDMPLYEQIGRKIYLTEVGEKVAATCREIINNLANLEMSIDEYKGLKRGRLRVSVVTTAKYFVPLALGEFMKAHQNTELQLNVSNRENLIRRIQTNLDDLYILGQIPPNDLDLEVIPFAPNPLVIIANRHHPLVGKKIGLKRLSEEPFILREEGSGIRSAVESLFSEHDLKVNHRLTMESNESIRHCVVGNLGVACVSQNSLYLDPDNGPIVELNVEGFPIQKEWNIVYPKGKELSVVAQKFLDYLQGEGKRFVLKG